MDFAEFVSVKTVCGDTRGGEPVDIPGLGNDVVAANGAHPV